MTKTLVASVLAATTPACAQVAVNPFDQAPPDVRDALKARVTEFYQDHVEGKYRKAEALVAEESKDGFYAATKPALQSFKIGDIAYSDHYRKAKVTVVGKMTMTFLGMAAPQLMDVPFPSYWKIEDGKWSWYIYQDPNRMTPFGRANGKSGEATASPEQAFASAPNVNAVLSGVKADRNHVKLAKTPGAKETVTLTNHMPGTVTLGLDAEQYTGLIVTLAPKALKAQEQSVLTIENTATRDFADRHVQVLVQPSNQRIDIVVRY